MSLSQEDDRGNISRSVLRFFFIDFLAGSEQAFGPSGHLASSRPDATDNRMYAFDAEPNEVSSKTDCDASPVIQAYGACRLQSDGRYTAGHIIQLTTKFHCRAKECRRHIVGAQDFQITWLDKVSRRYVARM